MINTFSPKGQFSGAIMPKCVLKQPHISMGAKVLYALMASYAFDKDHCWPSQARLAADMGVTTRSIQNYMSELEKLHLLFINREAGNKNMYYFCRNSIIELREQLKGTPENFSGVTHENFSPILIYNNKDKIPPLPPIAKVLAPTTPHRGEGYYGYCRRCKQPDCYRVAGAIAKIR